MVSCVNLAGRMMYKRYFGQTLMTIIVIKIVAVHVHTVSTYVRTVLHNKVVLVILVARYLTK